MGLIVQKFGGTSVADCEKILAAARKAIRAQREGHQVVMVVSAMGKNTDMLVNLAAEISERPPARELDMLLSTGEQVSVALMAMAIDALGHRAISLTGAQIGIRTDSTHTKARILSISTERVQALLDAGNIVIAAGFQGIDENYEITTLGRGGSDTTAVALAAVLNADACEIYTDVDGVYTTDPRIVPAARKLEKITYEEMLELASLGAKVLQTRSVELAMNHGVRVHVRSSFSDEPGTLVVDEEEIVEQQMVNGVTYAPNEAKITLRNVPDRPGVSAGIFGPLADANINVDMIVQNVTEDGATTDLTFTVPRDVLERAQKVLEGCRESIQWSEMTADPNVVKVSIVGVGMRSHVGVAKTMFRALAEKGINIQVITTSEIKVSVLIAGEYTELAVRALHSAFELDAA